MSKHNYRYAGVRGDCCGICVHNQCNDEATDFCEQSAAPWPSGPDDEHVCDLFKIQPDSTRLTDVNVDMELEQDIDEPYRGNVYAGPYKVIDVKMYGFTYMGKMGPVMKYAPLRGYKIVNKQ